MKTRFGYVSNSSSSSFMVYGEETRDEAEIERAVSSGKTVVCVDEHAGCSGECADFVFRLTPERLGRIKATQCMPLMLKRGRFHVLLSEETFDGDCTMDVTTPGISGKCLFKYRRDDRSPETDAVDDEEFACWLVKGTWKFPTDAEDRPMMIGRRITVDEAEKRVSEGKGVVFAMEDAWCIYTFTTRRREMVDRLVKACPEWLGTEECFFLESLDDFRSGDRIDLNGTYICASRECFGRMPNVRWMERFAEKYQGAGEEDDGFEE